MRRGRMTLFLAAAGAVATMTLSVPPAFAAGQDKGGGATIEEFVCYRSTDDRITLGTGRVVTTPSGETQVVCTGEPL